MMTDKHQIYVTIAPTRNAEAVGGNVVSEIRLEIRLDGGV
jgi:hypothetical protein